jgi:hypothetical protein
MIHVLHDIPESGRADVIGDLAELLKPGSRMSLLEPTSPRHGIAPEEIGDLLAGVGLSVKKMTKAVRRVQVAASKRKNGLRCCLLPYPLWSTKITRNETNKKGSVRGSGVEFLRKGGLTFIFLCFREAKMQKVKV